MHFDLDDEKQSGKVCFMSTDFKVLFLFSALEGHRFMIEAPELSILSRSVVREVPHPKLSITFAAYKYL